MLILRSRGAELEREFAFGVVRQLFEPHLAEAGEEERADALQGAAGMAGNLLGLPGAPAESADVAATPDPSFAVLHGLYWLCANLASQRPLCLLVDDAHWADGPSLRFLAFLLPRLEELCVALVVASRPREAGADDDLLATVTTDSSAEVVRLAPLTRAAVDQFLAERLGVEPDAAFVDACLRATRGTPFLMRELVVALQEDGIVPSADSAVHVERIGARTVGRSILLRLSRLPEHAGRLARAVSILERGDLLQAAKLADLEPTEAALAADMLAAGGILERDRPLTFVHPIVRTGIYAELSSVERARGHRAAARLLAEQEGTNEHVAEHLLASEPAGDPWTVDRLVDAARAASRSGAPESTAVYLRRALDEPPATDERPRLLLEVGMAEASAGLPGWRPHLQAAVDGAAEDAARVAAARVLAQALARAQRSAEAIDVLDRAAASLDPSADDLAVLLEAAAVGVGMIDGATAPAVVRRRQAARERAEDDAAAPPELLAVAAFTAVLTNEPAANGVALARRALAAGRDALPDRTDRPWFSYATWFSQTTVALLWAEEYDDVRPLLDASIAKARASGDSGRLAVGLAHRGWLCFRRGDLSAAEDDLRTALEGVELPAPTLYRVLNGGILVATLVELGELDAAEVALAPMDEQAESGSLTAAVLLFSRGRLRVAQGRTQEGLADLLAVGELADRTRVTCPSYLPWRSEAALAHLLLGQADTAQRLAQEELELARSFGTPRALGVALRVAGVVAGGRRGEAHLREALEVLSGADAVLEQARAQTDLGALVRRANRRTEARELLREALDVAHRARAKPLAERAETELRATGARPRRVVLTGLDSLTASERRVAELASTEMTNREIAQELFVTARTVEGHLTSVFRKLDVSSRDELPALFAAAPSG
jgi:DNA-binding CsgD family transcriptional regulator